MLEHVGARDVREKLLDCVSAHNMFEELWQMEENVQIKAMTLMWEWWGVRNKANAGEGVLTSQVVCNQVERHVVEFLSLKHL